MGDKKVGRLVIAAKRGDKRAQEELYKQTSSAAYYTALRVLGNEQDALDAVQDSYVTVFSSLKDLKDNDSFIGWLKKIVANRCKDIAKKKSPVLFNSEEQESSVVNLIEEKNEAFLPAAYIEQSEKRNQIMHIIDGLPDAQKAAILFFYYDDMNTHEIAEALGCTESTVTSRIAYAKQRIRKGVEQLEKQGDKLYGAAALPVPFLKRLFQEDAKHHTMSESTAKTVLHNVMTSSAVVNAGAANGAGIGLFAKFAGMGIAGKCAVAGVAAAVVVSGSMVGSTLAYKNDQLSKFVDSHKNATITLAKPSIYTISVKGTQNDEFWKQLDQMDTYPEFRTQIDRLFKIKKVTMNGVNGKSGCLYIDSTGDRNGNTCLADAFRNKLFVEYYFKNNKAGFASAAFEAYTDLTYLDENTNISAAFNAYYGLLKDADNPSSFNGTQSLSREQFYYLMYKECHGVNKDFLKDFKGNDDPFVKSTTGTETSYSAFAKQMAGYGYLQTSNGSLNKNITASMSRIEAVYAVIQANFKKTYDKFDESKFSSQFKDIKSGGDIAGDYRGKDKWQQYALAYMIANQDKGLDKDLYKAAIFAQNYNLISPDNNGSMRWDEPISKSEAIQLMVNVELAKDQLYGYLTTNEYGKNNPAKFTIASGSMEMVDGRIVFNPQTDDKTGAVYGNNAEGQATTTQTDQYKAAQQRAGSEAQQQQQQPASKPSSTKPAPQKPAQKPSGNTGGGSVYDGGDIPIPGGGSVGKSGGVEPEGGGTTVDGPSTSDGVLH